MTATHQDVASTPRDELPRRPRTWRAALLVLLVVLALVVALAVRQAHHVDRAAHAAASRSRTPTVTASGSTSGASGLVSAPENVTWHLYRGLALPTSASAGPSRIQGPVDSGYAHTPTGALLAAAQISARYLITPSGGWRQVLSAQVIPGPGRDAFTALRAQLSDDAPVGGFAQYAGFRFTTYTPQLAVISVATQSHAGALEAADITVQWSAGDWKVQIPSSGLAEPQALASLVGYVPWSGLS